MFDRVITATRPHFAEIARLSVRDTELMFASMMLMCALCWHVGYPVVAVSIGLAIFTSEALMRLIFARKWPVSHLGQSQAIGAALILHGLNAVLYTAPAYFLAGDPSFAMKITGLVFVMGTQVYIANAWSGIPVFVYVLLLPSMGMLALTFLHLPSTAPVASSLTHWAIAVGTLFLFIYSAIDTLRQHLGTQLALFNAQRDAASRLALLEEAHRLDALTGVLNRPAFDVALNVMLEDRVISGGEITVFLVDLDSFKPINDTYSHEAGDQVLIETARRLAAIIGEGGIVGRLGGDEFICAVPDLSATDDVLAFGQTLSAAIARPFEWNGRTFKVVASLGAAITGDNPASPPATVSALCSAADQAMFTAKSSPNRMPVVYDTQFYAPRMTAEDKQVLVDSIANRSLRLFFQPKIHLPTGQIIGFEALVRWDHPQDGLRMPGDFMDQINELGLQGDLMVSLANQVVESIRAFLQAGLDPGQISLNVPEVALATLSGRQDLQSIIEDNPEVAKHLTFEITEDVFIARAADTIQASITGFRDLGVRISLDDFGTGFASFHHLRQLDFDELKIDTSFVAGLGHDPTSEVLVRGFLSIASGLGVSVIAEGVETESQSRDLINMGCLTAQGFLYSPAIPLEHAMKLLAKQHAA